MKNLIQSQYNVESSLDNRHSPLSMGSDNVAKNPQDYDLMRMLQRQINTLQQEIRRLHNRHKELHNEVARLRSQIK